LKEKNAFPDLNACQVASKLKPGILAEPVLVGREREVEELMRCLDEVSEGRGTTVFISGEAGSGKTRLVNEFLNIAKEKEINILTGWCLSNFAVPYLPFKEAFNAYFKTRKTQEQENARLRQPKGQAEPCEYTEAEIKAWLSSPQVEKPEKLQNLTPQGWQDLAVTAITKTLLSISEKKTTILFIDDAHWADSASISLLHYISRSICTTRILVLATYRSEELSPDIEGRPHPLLETLRLMRREDLIREIKLPNLNQTSVAALAEKMVGGSLNAELVDRLAEESRGNPLFIVESLRMLFERRDLVQEDGRWRLSIDEVGIPAKIKDIILRRVGILKPNQRRILDLASVIGEKFDVELISAVLDQDNLEVLEALNAVSQSSSLVCCEGSYYEFDHAKSREAIYEEIPPPLKRGYHARIAEKMEAKSKDAKDLPVNDLAYHFVQAGNRGKAVKYSLVAGKDALKRFSNTEAAKHYAYVLEAVSESTDYAIEREKALEGLGDALRANGFYVGALKTFEELSSIAESGMVKLRALWKAVFCSQLQGDITHSLELASKADEYAHFDRIEYARLRLVRGAAGRLVRAKDAFADVEEALKVFEEDYSLPDVANALSVIIFFYIGEDRLEDELVVILRSVKMYEELEDLRGQVTARSRLGMAFGACGFIQEMINNDEKAFKIGEKIGAFEIMAVRLMARGMFAQRIGDLNEAVALSLKAVKYAEKTEAYTTTTVCYANLVRYYAMLGEIKQAEEFSKKIEKIFDAQASLRGMEEAEISKAYLFSAKGQYNEANEIFENRMKRQSKSLWGSDVEAYWKTGYAWSLRKQGRTEEAERLFDDERKRLKMVIANAERFQHAKVHVFLMASKEIGVGEELNIRLDMVNAAKNHPAIERIEGIIPPEFKVSSLPTYCSIQNGSLDMKRRKLGSFAVEPLKLSLQATKPGVFTLSPQVIYTDDLGETKTYKPKPVTITVRPTLHAKIGKETITVPILPNRIATGLAELDALLYGGIPQNHAVILTSPPTDVREQLIRHFLEERTTAHTETVYITTEPRSAKALAKNYPSDFYLFVCNPRADVTIENAPNIFKLKGVENLTEIDIALAKVFRILDPSKAGSKRACIDILSDVLLQHHAVVTRKWLSGLLADLRARDFTTLATVNPTMHPLEEIQAILGLFEGEIDISEKETAEGLQQVLRIRRLNNQKYLENELTLAKQFY
jgi:tetratricopeptide (TPR) repeat protein/KaiC/GvpD/RAD55 family RecA-like ATPase